MVSISPADVVIDASTGLIAAVLLVSGITKLPSPVPTLRVMEGFGIPRVLRRRWIARALPIAELAIGLALLLLPGWGRFVAALAASAILLVFTVLVIRAVANGSDVSCECFGALSRDRVDGWTVARNLVLLLAAATAAFAGVGAPALLPSLLGRPFDEIALLIVVWLILGVVALLRWNLDQRAQLARLRRGDAAVTSVRPHELAVGDPIPDAELVNRVGVTLPLDRLDRGRAVLLIFLKAGCSSCERVVPWVPEWERRIGDTVTVRIATSSRPDEIDRIYPELGDRVRYGARAARAALGADRLPSAVVLGSNGMVASPVARGAEEIEALVNGIAEAQATLANSNGQRGDHSSHA